MNDYEIIGKVLLGLPENSLKELFNKIGIETNLNEDELFCLHYQTFGGQILPYLGAFSGEQFDLDAFYAEIGERPEFKKESPDHIGLQFLLYSELKEKKVLFESLIFPWFQLFALTVKREAEEPFKSLACLILEKVEESNALTSSGITLEKETGLKDITKYLTTPFQSGFYLSLSSLKKIAKRTDLPLSFGGRSEVLLQLIYTSLDYDKWEALLVALIEEVKGWEVFYQQNLKRSFDLLEKVNNTREFLGKIRQLSNLPGRV